MQRSLVPLPGRGNVVFLRLKGDISGSGTKLFFVRSTGGTHQDYCVTAWPRVEGLRPGWTAVFRSAWGRGMAFLGKMAGGAAVCRIAGPWGLMQSAPIEHPPRFLACSTQEIVHVYVLISIAADGAIGGCRGWSWRATDRDPTFINRARFSAKHYSAMITLLMTKSPVPGSGTPSSQPESYAPLPHWA